ncbi:MAG: DNA-formamidopyrimidine glycosylase [Anaerolineae bacterium]
MPELPEVETTVRDLRPHLVGHAITAAAVHWRRTIAQPSMRVFTREIVGYRIREINRRGKYLVFVLEATEGGRPQTDNRPTGTLASRRAAEPPSDYTTSQPSDDPTRYLLVHLRMTGGFRFHQPEEKRDKHVHVALQLDDGRELRFRDPRKFGRMWLVNDPEIVTGKLGPEPFEITKKEFAQRIRQHKGRIKPLLLNQSFIAGVGNIYADESLWYARIHPLREVSTLSDAEIGVLYTAIRRVLKKAIGVGGTSIDITYKRINGMSGQFQEDLRAVGRTGEPCYRCGTPIIKTVVGQRGTHYCPNCQKLDG